MRASIVIPVLDSHEVFRRQCVHFEKQNLGKDVEIIIVDDGSNPPLQYTGKLPLTILRTNDSRPWTWALARNRGAEKAVGDWLIFYDLDHIVCKPLVDMVCKYDGDIVQFKRQFGVILPDGVFTQDISVLVEYGWPKSRYASKKLTLSAHPNMFAIKRNVFMELGKYREDLVENPYPQGEDRLFKRARYEWIKQGKGDIHPDRPIIYMFPNGKVVGDVDCDPKGLFHKLTRANKHNPIYRKQVATYGPNRNISHLK